MSQELACTIANEECSTNAVFDQALRQLQRAELRDETGYALQIGLLHRARMEAAMPFMLPEQLLRTIEKATFSKEDREVFPEQELEAVAKCARQRVLHCIVYEYRQSHAPSVESHSKTVQTLQTMVGVEESTAI